MNTGRLLVYRMVSRWIPESRGFGIKAALLRWAGASVGRNVRVYSSVRIMGTGRLEIGDDVHLGVGCSILSFEPAVVKIGNCVDIAPEVMLHTGTHAINPGGPHLAGENRVGSIIIGDGCWLGTRANVLAGVELAEQTLVAAGAVVTRTVAEPNSLVAGVPAVVRKRLAAGEGTKR